MKIINDKNDKNTFVAGKTHIFELIFFIVRVVNFDELLTNPRSGSLNSKECHVVFILQHEISFSGFAIMFPKILSDCFNPQSKRNPKTYTLAKPWQ